MIAKFDTKHSIYLFSYSCDHNLYISEISSEFSVKNKIKKNWRSRQTSTFSIFWRNHCYYRNKWYLIWKPWTSSRHWYIMAWILNSGDFIMNLAVLWSKRWILLECLSSRRRMAHFAFFLIKIKFAESF